MEEKLVLDVGNCAPDHAAIKHTLTAHFDVKVIQSHGPSDTLELALQHEFSLILINRKLDQDYSDGIEILRMLKRDPQLSEIPVMIVTNYEEHQAAAVSEGAEPGFGKLSLGAPETLSRLRRWLE